MGRRTVGAEGAADCEREPMTVSITSSRCLHVTIRGETYRLERMDGSPNIFASGGALREALELAQLEDLTALLTGAAERLREAE